MFCTTHINSFQSSSAMSCMYAQCHPLSAFFNPFNLLPPVTTSELPQTAASPHER